MSKRRYEYNDLLSDIIRIHPILTVLAAMLFLGPLGLFLWFYLDNKAKQGNARRTTRTKKRKARTVEKARKA